MNRESLISSGEHIYAVRTLGAAYDVEEYIDAIDHARARGEGQKYAAAVLGPDVGAEPDDGADLLAAAQADLRGRGVDPETATQAQMLAAYERVMP